MMAFDKETGQAIATLMHRLRPDWDTPGCLAAVAKVNTLDPFNVAMAAIRLCGTPDAQTPMALATRDGQHWRERIATSAVRYPPRSDQACTKHPGEWPDNCRGCAGDRLAADTSDASNRGRTEGDVGRLRHLVNVATDGFCSHGVDPQRCLEHRAKPDETEEQG